MTVFRWLIADGFIPSTSQGQLESHESLCIVNPHPDDASVQIKVFFEDRDPIEGIAVVCPSGRTRHIRVDTLTGSDGRTVPRGVPYAMELTCPLEVGVQLSRLDSTQSQLALMTVSGVRVST
ncbi:MAG: hypothetical protein K6T83_15625 [Alicyclobacillus sp.]|nr:hypothetical protein [Alicyclobacillus sp.]